MGEERVDIVMKKLRESGNLHSDDPRAWNSHLTAEANVAALSRPENERVADELEREAEFAADAGLRDGSWCRVNRRTLEDWARRLRGGR